MEAKERVPRRETGRRGGGWLVKCCQEAQREEHNIELGNMVAWKEQQGTELGMTS